MREIKTIESVRYEEMEDHIHVKRVGMIPAAEAFDQLKKHLEEVGLLPDEYFLPSHDWKEGEELPEFRTAVCHTDWGGSEGIYVDILLEYYEDSQLKRFPFATGKTLDQSGDAFMRMSRIAAECSLMLNGYGSKVKVSERFYEGYAAPSAEIGESSKAAGDKAPLSEKISQAKETRTGNVPENEKASERGR